MSGKAATARQALATAPWIRRLGWVVAAVAGAAALFWCALREARAIPVQSVRSYPKPGLAAYRWELDRALLDSRTHDVNFLVATAPRSYAGATVTEREGITKFGKPYRIYRFQRYVILVWRKTCCRN